MALNRTTLRLAKHALLLGACAALTSCAVTGEDAGSIERGIPSELSVSILENATYTIASRAARTELLSAGAGLEIRLRNGVASFPPDLLALRNVRIDPVGIVYGDLDDDGNQEAVVPLVIGMKRGDELELAVMKSDEDAVREIASFPLGRSVLQSLRVSGDKIAVATLETAPGDPSSRRITRTLRIGE